MKSSRQKSQVKAENPFTLSKLLAGRNMKYEI